MSDLLSILILLLIVGTCLYEAKRSRFDPFQPIYFVLVGFSVVYCIQYGYGRNELRVWFHESDITYALALALVGLLLLIVGYYSRLAVRLAILLPKPRPRWRPGSLTPFALALIALAVVGQLWFVSRSGGAEAYWSQPRGAGAFETNTAYLYGLKWLLTPGIIFLAVDSARKEGLSRFLWLPIAVAWFVYHFAMGQRAGVFTVGVLTMACLFVPRQAKASPVLVLAGVALLALTVGFVGLFRSEFHMGSDLEATREFSDKSAREQLQILAAGTFTGGRTSLNYAAELPMYINYVRIFPEHVDFDYGMEYSQLLVAWIPRLLWPSRPDWREPKREAIHRTIGTSHLDGPVATMFGMYYTHLGAVSLFVGAFLTGALLGAVARMRVLWPDSMGVMLVFLSFFDMHGLPLGNGPVSSFRFWGVWVLAPIVLASLYLKVFGQFHGTRAREKAAVSVRG